MTDPSTDARIPLRVPTVTATFVIAIAGFLAVNLSTYMITALQNAVGTDFVTAGWIVTGVLLATALVGLAVAPLCASRARLSVARGGLLLAAITFGAAALMPQPAVIIAGVLLGGVGAGGAVAASGAAFAAFVNPDRIAGINGLANRGVIAVVLAVVPVLGLTPFNVFGALALFSLLGLAVSPRLPQAPLVQAAPQGTHGISRRVVDRKENIAGLVLLSCFALWAVTEDSLWAMGGALGASQSGVTDQQLGIALSGATAGGLIGSALLMIVGGKLGRALPLGILMVAGSALKLSVGFATTPVAYIVLFIAWNTLYAVVFMYFIATAAALAADGRWSGAIMAVYLVGSSLTPIIGAGLLTALGNQGFTIALAIASTLLAVPVVAVALYSTRKPPAEGQVLVSPGDFDLAPESSDA